VPSSSTIDWSPYQDHYDHVARRFTKRQAAKDLTSLLSAELQLNWRSFIVEKDGQTYHLYNAFTGTYWMPSSKQDWDTEFEQHRKSVRKVMQS
jgi:hypothetical protein